MKEKLRSEIEEKNKWDLSVLYLDDNSWNEDYKALKESISSLERYKGILLKDAKTLLDFIVNYYKIDRKLEKVYYYVHLQYDSETMNSKYQELDGKVTNLFKDISVVTSYVEPELLKGDYSAIEKFYEDEPKLKEYKNFFIELFRYKNHVLSEKEEYILSKLNKSLSLAEDAYEKLTDTDLTLGEIKDEKGNNVVLTDSNYIKYISNKDRRVREDAFHTMNKGYGSVINTISTTL